MRLLLTVFALFLPIASGARVLAFISAYTSGEPRFRLDDAVNSAHVTGVDVDGWRPGTAAVVDAPLSGYIIASLRDLPPGRFRAQRAASPCNSRYPLVIDRRAGSDGRADVPSRLLQRSVSGVHGPNRLPALHGREQQ